MATISIEDAQKIKQDLFNFVFGNKLIPSVKELLKVYIAEALTDNETFNYYTTARISKLTSFLNS